jgi:ABC-type polysaccharide/polyol phosphate export permease
MASEECKNAKNVLRFSRSTTWARVLWLVLGVVVFVGACVNLWTLKMRTKINVGIGGLYVVIGALMIAFFSWSIDSNNKTIAKMKAFIKEKKCT